MKKICALLISLFFITFSYAESVVQKIDEDSVSIGYIPSREAHRKGELVVVLEAKTRASHKNKEIEKIFTDLSNLASEGVTDNATQFHKRTMYIDAFYQGKRVRLFFSGDSQLDKFSHYEKKWKLLHDEIYHHLSEKISPNKALQHQLLRSLDSI